MPTNKELAGQLSELREELEELKARTVTRVKENAPKVAPAPAPAISGPEKEYLERIAPEVEAWEQKIAKITAERAEEDKEARGVGPSPLRLEKIRQRVEADFPYDGPPRSYSKYKAVQRMEHDAKEAQEEKARASEGVEEHQFKDPFGIVRDRTTGTVAN